MASPAAPLAPRPRPGRTRAVAVVLALAGLAVPALLLLPRDRTPAGSVTGSAAPADARPGTADGVLTGAVTVSAGVPALTRLDPALLAALRRAALVAGRDGVELQVNSGWRSPAYQEQLLRDAVARYGSPAEAARWVAPPQTSEHVSGHAVDVGPPAAATWLAGHGAAYGLCRTYGNEPWHYELRPAASVQGCPTPYADPAHDPRLRR